MCIISFSYVFIISNSVIMSVSMSMPQRVFVFVLIYFNPLAVGAESSSIEPAVKGFYIGVFLAHVASCPIHKSYRHTCALPL